MKMRKNSMVKVKVRKQGNKVKERKSMEIKAKEGKSEENQAN